MPLQMLETTIVAVQVLTPSFETETVTLAQRLGLFGLSWTDMAHFILCTIRIVLS